MVQRATGKIKATAVRSKEPPANPDRALKLEQRAKTLEQERDALKAELDVARQRIAALEESRSAVAGRIDWVIESLHGIVAGGD